MQTILKSEGYAEVIGFYWPWKAIFVNIKCFDTFLKNLALTKNYHSEKKTEIVTGASDNCISNKPT